MSMELFSGKVLPIEISDELKKSFIDYSMSVIVSRALPDVRDGLKPVHRRILYAMNELGMTPNKGYSKSARLVGDCMGKYHPHGDSSIYDASVRMAQNFSSRYPLIDGHGNFGSIDGDSAAAMRYTEMKMASLATYMLADIDKDTVNFSPNYDEREKEPDVLPAKFPNLLVNGSSGIAVGMATNIPPHNLGEVIDGVVYLMDSEDNEDGAPRPGIRDLMKFIKGPDFPTGAQIMGTEGIISAYTTGRGSIKVRAKANIEKIEKNGKMQIVVTEIPYVVNKSRLIEKIAELVQEKKIEGITDLRDETTMKGIRIVIELRRDVTPQVILNQLYKHTQMEDSFGINMLALVDNTPKVLNLQEILEYFIKHQKEVIVRRSRFELKKAEDEAHIVEGLRKALDYIDEVIEIIRSSKDDDIAKAKLILRFDFSDRQAQAIMDMRLKRLTGLEREKLDAQYQRLMDEIAYLTAVLNSDKMVRGIIKTELKEIRDKFADPRRSEITFDATKMEIEDLIADEDVVITVTHRGYIKRLPLNTYHSQRRGGRGVNGMSTGENDFVESLFIASTHHHILFFTSRGKVYRLRAHEIPEASRTAKGTAIVNLLSLAQDEKVTATIAVKEFKDQFNLLTATKNGIVKKTSLQDYDTKRSDGLIALTLDENDELIGVRLTKQDDDVVIATRLGLAIRFSEEDVRAMGRTARGVRGISLRKDDYVIAMDVVDKTASDLELLTVTENGFAKRSELSEFRIQGRGGKGIIGHRVTSKTGPLAAVKVVTADQELMVITDEGIVIRQEVSGISVQGRSAQGVTAMRTGESKVVAVAKFVSKEEE
ncbi:MULTISPECIES: DNA gyrase subunit A [Dehalobacter]|uniref:DNA gyrase subunit A n=2 Tax=Dehalobacter restrictus TaxID=55583 RepID=A0A857DF75_9FIRM|nr:MULTISPECIES: DNA gyrase subunit A [Dehalobacter]AHF08718.1 DNA gyrase subunit A [Dehalobacter restrictus DSM 9455]MCG1024186.1 DNA gyrase subunit A [Dehalobacter sp.]MDJ0305331.1 DNA gyrase subunit A [Dehalobacter sp.]OCZ49813.1 DNA gyrase subunit A [Dehalobacter sp. TeCB1]QGZ99171.1 DNA gyrase subunit A [Dehalobacter restrictus]